MAFSELNTFCSLLNVEVTDFAIYYVAILITNRVSKFTKCFYIILLCCAIFAKIKLYFMRHLALLHVVSRRRPLLFGASSVVRSRDFIRPGRMDR